MAKPGHQRRGSGADISKEFRELTLKDAKSSLNAEMDKLIKTAPPHLSENTRKEFDGFQRLFGRYLYENLRDEGSTIKWDDIKVLPDEAVKPYAELETDLSSDQLTAMLNKLVVLKLNGGLGTSMGCTGPKSLISVRNELTFLDLTVQQIEHLNKTYGVSVPLVLMNSFNTEDDTEKILRKYQKVNVDIRTFNQSSENALRTPWTPGMRYSYLRYPRINKESLLPIAKSVNADDIASKGYDDLDPHDSWYPPGHGDVYESFYNSGKLQEYIDKGKEYVFISNIDNMGATADVNILNFLVNQVNGPAPEFVMEVTDKTRADVKGGTLIEYEKRLRLLEIAQVPKDKVDEFKSVNKFKIFNTNNLWIKLSAMKRVIEESTLHMEIIVNPKTLDNGLNVIQLETAVGAAIKSFEGAVGVNVPRARFLPVKTTSDLLIVMSNLYSLKNGTLKMSPLRCFPSVPLVKLGTSFKKVKEYLSRFASVPDMIELDHLTVSGDVSFGKGVSLKGTVIIIANHGEKIDIPPGAILENKIVSGNLRILDH